MNAEKKKYNEFILIKVKEMKRNEYKKNLNIKQKPKKTHNAK